MTSTTSVAGASAPVAASAAKKEPAAGTLNANVVKRIDPNASSCAKVAFKVLAVALVIVGIACILSAMALGAGLLFAGKLAALDLVVTPIVAALGVKWAIVAASVAGAIGIAKLIGGIVMLKNASGATPRLSNHQAHEKAGVPIEVSSFYKHIQN